MWKGSLIRKEGEGRSIVDTNGNDAKKGTVKSSR